MHQLIGQHAVLPVSNVSPDSYVSNILPNSNSASAATDDTAQVMMTPAAKTAKVPQLNSQRLTWAGSKALLSIWK